MSTEVSAQLNPPIRRTLLALVFLVGGLVLLLFFVPRLGYKRTTLRTCFRNAEGLRLGSPVQIAGVKVGIVQFVRARPEVRDCPADVEITLQAPYKLEVPNDAIAKIGQEGLLGGSYLNIDVSKATGTAVRDDATLRSEEPRHVSPELVRALVEAAIDGKPPREIQPPKTGKKNAGN